MRHRFAARMEQMAWLALGAAIVFAPFHYRLVLLERLFPPIYEAYTNITLYISDGFALATLLLWGMSLIANRRRPTLGPAFLAWPIAGLLGIGLVSGLFALDPALSFYHVLRLSILGGVSMFIVNQGPAVNRITFAVALQLLIQSGIGVIQVLQQSSLGLANLGELELDPAWSGVSVVWADGVRSLRAYGLSAHPNILGGCLAFGLILIAGWYVKARDPWRIPLAGLFTVGLAGLLLTFSRAAWLAFGSALLLGSLLFLSTHQKLPFLKGSRLLAAGMLLISPLVWHNASYLGARLNRHNSFDQVRIEKRSIDERLVLNDATLRLVLEHPWTGVGLGNVPLAQRERYSDFTFNYQPAHMVLLNVAAETGLLGALLYLAALVGPWIALWRDRHRLTFSPALIAASSALLAVTIVGFFDYYTWLLPSGRLWQWLTWGLWASVYQSSIPESQHA